MCLYTKVANGDITILPVSALDYTSGTNFNSCVHKFGLTVQCDGIRDTTGTEIDNHLYITSIIKYHNRSLWIRVNYSQIQRKYDTSKIAPRSIYSTIANLIY